MKFLSRSLSGLFLFALTLGILLLAGGQIFTAMRDAQNESVAGRTPKERMFSVNVDTLESVTAKPVITSYGTVESWRSLELRTSVAGTLVELAPEFRDGGVVTAGQVLFQIDPSKLETAAALAEIDLAEAKAEVADASAALLLTQSEINAAEAQLELRTQGLVRQQDLQARGVSTDPEVEAAILAQSAAETSLVGREQAYAQAVTRASRSEITLDRKEIALVEARRIMAEATVTASFDGVMSDVTAVLGRLVSSNEKLGTLIDPAALEASFRVSNTQFARLLDDDGQLRTSKVHLILVHGSTRVEVDGKIERAGAEVGDGQIGRLLYARLLSADASVLRPGDFLTVEIPEPPLENVAIIPASAATADGRILLLGEGDRLEEVTVKILRRQGDEIIVSGAPFDRMYVIERSSQIGAGIQVKPLEPVSAEDAAAAAAAPPAEPEMIALDDERRAKLIAFIEANENMAADSKARVLGELAAPEVSLELVERFEAKME